MGLAAGGSGGGGGGASPITAQFSVTGIITPPALSNGYVNDYNPTGLETAAVLRLSTAASPALTGIAGGSAGRILILQNVGSIRIQYYSESVQSSAENRISVPDRFIHSGTCFLRPKETVVLQYDGTISMWRQIGGSVCDIQGVYANGGNLEFSFPERTSGQGANVITNCGTLDPTNGELASRSMIVSGANGSVMELNDQANDLGSGGSVKKSVVLASDQSESIYERGVRDAIKADRGGDPAMLENSLYFDALEEMFFPQVVLQAEDQHGVKLRIKVADAMSTAIPTLYYPQINGDGGVFEVAKANAAPATTGTISVDTHCSAITITPTGDCTFNDARGGYDGQRLTFVVTTTGTTSRTLTFGTKFKSTGTLATGTVSGKTFTISFIYDGINWCETGRTTAM